MIQSLKKYNVILAYFVMIFSFISGYPVFYGEIGSFLWYFLYYGKYVLSVLFVVYAIVTGEYDAREIALVKKFGRWFLLYPVAMLVYSVVPWVLRKPSFDFVSRGVSTTLYMCIGYAGGLAIALNLKEKVFKCGIWACITTYILSLSLGLINGGVEFLKTALFFRTTAVQGRYSELHEVAFIIGLYLLFFLFFNKNRFVHETRLPTILAAIFYIIAWKRIGLAAFVLVSIFALAVPVIAKKYTSKVMLCTGIVTTLVCLVYVAFSTSDVLVNFLTEHGINMMGRNIIYAYFRKFCDFVPTFLGRGVGFVTRQFDYATADDLYNMISIKALHNDFMKTYIEIGFVGFLLWCSYWVIWIPRRLERFAGMEAAFTCLCLILFAFITYTTDNTAGYYSFQMHLLIMMYTVTYCIRKQEEGPVQQ